MLEIRRRIAHLPSAVVRLVAFELTLGRRIGDLTALVAEIESQIFAGVRFLIAVAESAIERIVGFRFIRPALASILGRLWRGRRLRRLNGLARWRWLSRLRADLRLRREARPRLCTLDDVALDRRLERTRTRSRGPNRSRRLRLVLGRWRRRFAHFRRHRIGVEHMAASRALESRCIVGQDPLVNPIAGVATGALNFDHTPTSHPAQKIITRRWLAHLRSAA